MQTISVSLRYNIYDTLVNKRHVEALIVGSNQSSDDNHLRILIERIISCDIMDKINYLIGLDWSPKVKLA